MLNADVKNFQFTSDFDGLEIDASIAVPSSNINGIVQIVHGMCEYKGGCPPAFFMRVKTKYFSGKRRPIASAIYEPLYPPLDG